MLEEILPNISGEGLLGGSHYTSCFNYHDPIDIEQALSDLQFELLFCLELQKVKSMLDTSRCSD